MFKEKFKYFKSKTSPPDLSSVIGCTSLMNDIRVKRKYIEADINEESVLSELGIGLRISSSWEVYEVTCCSGLWLVKNPFNDYGHIVWPFRTLVEYPGPPNQMNLHAHCDIGRDENWWRICQSNLDRRKLIYKKLRWVTLGYHHDWNTKVYSEKNKSEFPEDLRLLTGYVAKKIGNWHFKAEAAIVNYYHFGSTLSGHTDNSEADCWAPLLSFSFGQKAIFLIGGRNIDDNCDAILLESGDTLVMSGESRLCYHGVPLILPAVEAPWNSSAASNIECCSLIHDYLNTSRININVRQVLKDGQLAL